ncbi:hypothetical protein FNP20_002389 [Enterococcus faecium]|nr:hypothetical protein [Enterococcus faecium]
MENNQKSVKELLEEYKERHGVRVCPKATKEEAETIINFDPITQEWSIYTTVPSMIREIVKENYLTSIYEVYYSGKGGTVITSLEGTLYREPSLYSTK